MDDRPNTSSPLAGEALEEIRALFESRDGREVAHLLDESIELRPPTYGKPWHGRRLVAKLLRFASQALRDMRYTDSWQGEGHHVLRFEGRVGEEPISGVDVIRVGRDGLITEFEIFARPPRAVLKLREEMGARVRSDPEVAAMMGLKGEVE